MQAIAALGHPAKLQAHAVCFQKCMGITLGVEHTDLIKPGAQIPSSQLPRSLWAGVRRLKTTGLPCCGFAKGASASDSRPEMQGGLQATQDP